MNSFKLFALAVMSFLNGDGCYSEQFERWLEKKRRECKMQSFKLDGAKWMFVIFEISECGYLYQAIKSEKERTEMHERMKCPEWKDHWNFVEELAIF